MEHYSAQSRPDFGWTKWRSGKNYLAEEGVEPIVGSFGARIVLGMALRIYGEETYARAYARASGQSRFSVQNEN
jgi:hypothetical protein